jgi:hypothetical protein
MTATATATAIISNVSMIPKLRASRATNREVMAAARIDRKRKSQAICAYSKASSDEFA